MALSEQLLAQTGIKAYPPEMHFNLFVPRRTAVAHPEPTKAFLSPKVIAGSDITK